MSEVVVDMVALLLEHIDALVLNLPARAAKSADIRHLGGCQLMIGSPAVMIGVNVVTERKTPTLVASYMA